MIIQLYLCIKDDSNDLEDKSKINKSAAAERRSSVSFLDKAVLSKSVIQLKI